MIFHPLEIVRCTTYVMKLFERGKSVKIEPVSEPKTRSQNAYLWLIFTHIAHETGYSKDDIYQLCLTKFPFHKEIVINGEMNLIPITLSGMTKEQTIQFLNEITAYFRSEGYDIPDPEDKRLELMYCSYKERGLL